MSLEDIQETYLLIAVLEGLAARQIATRVRRGMANAALTELKHALDGTIPHRSPDGWAFPDNRFHIALDAACPLPHLRTLLQGLWAMIPRDPIGLVQGRAQRVTPDHTAILDAIAAGDGARAERLVRRHLAWVSRTRLQFLESVPTRPKSDHLPGGNGPAGSQSAGSVRRERKRRRGSK